MGRLRLPLLLGVLAVIVVVVIGVMQAGGGSGSSPPGPSAAEQRSALAGSPPPLAALQARSGALLDGGAAAFHRQLAALRGYPVVVFKWASWCGPCRAEAGLVARAGVAVGRRVALIGLDFQDGAASARQYLGQYPQPYPSFVDGDGAIADSLGAPYQPATVFFDRRGRRVLTRQGPYGSPAELERDVARYAGA